MQGNVFVACARRVFFWVAVVVASLVSVPAFAANPAIEKEAQALQKKAIDEDSLNVDYAGAVKKLQSAAAKCDGDKCTPAIKGAILRDLGAMQILAGNDGDGRASFAQAIAVDAQLDLDPAYKTPQLEAVWNEVKKKAPAGNSGGTETSAPPGQQPSGDFAHTPAPEAPVRTPLPIYAEYSGSEQLARVIAKYKAPGMTDWKPIELPKMGTGFGGLIPCKDVLQGTVSYYIQGFNAGNDPVATSGSRNKPYTVAVKTQITGPAPSLPGQDAPKQCGDLAGAECPPDFPGCNSKKSSGEDCDKDSQCSSNACVGGKCAEKKGGGDDCEKDDECASGSCSDSKCTAAKKSAGDDCESNDECDSDSCKEGKCSGGGGGAKFTRVWVGLAVSLDFYVMPGAQNVCSKTQGSINSAGYGCIDSAGASFPPDANFNGAIVQNRSDQVEGGFVHGPLTIMASFDYALNQNMMIGARAGYEALTIPTGSAFAPVHLEARFTYLFGKDALTAKVAPMAFVGLGAGEFDAFVPVNVFLDGSKLQGQSNTGIIGPGKENAWLTAGPVFAAAGGGVRYM
ncbi:MAG TPA: hypothetical protein VHS09_16315, partial [Polyangiaceae bacterium]|nr:hypothetical protein [Polyangiaceae bacterium]